MLRRLPFKQLLEWEAFDQLEPIGGRRGDWQAASICSMLANIAIAKGRSRKRFQVKDFLLEFGNARPSPSGRRQTWQEQKMILMQIAEAMIPKGT